MAGRPGSFAAYDAIADWYAGWVIGSGADYMARAYAALQRSLGRGTGVCWDLACGTGESASVLNELGWTVVGSDISRGQLRHASKRIPVVLADATRPPVQPGTIAAVASVLCHTDVDDYAAVCGLTVDRVEEAGDPTPDVLAIGAYRPREQTGSADELA